MAQLLHLPQELFDIIIERLVVHVGIYRAVSLRRTSKAFDAAILRAICDVQVLDIHDAATPYLANNMSPKLRGRIIATKIRTKDIGGKAYVQAASKACQTLDILIHDDDPEARRARHEHIGADVLFLENGKIDAATEAQNALCAAASIGDLRIVETLLNETSADVDARTPFFHRPLALAAFQGHLEVVRYLLYSGAHPMADYRLYNGDEYIRETADWNRCTDLVTRSGVFGRGLPHPSALRAAVKGEHRKVIELLLSSKYKLPNWNVEWLRVISAAASVGRLDLMRMLLDGFGKELSDFSGLGDFLIFEAIRHSHNEMARWLFEEQGVSINAYPPACVLAYSCPLSLAASRGNLGLVNYLLERGADVNFNFWGREGSEPVANAARCGHHEIVETFLDHGADPVLAFVTAASNAEPRLVQSLLERFTDLLEREKGLIGIRALGRAITAGNLDMITILVEAGMPISFGEGFSPTPMEVAKMTGQWVVDHLISLGAADDGKEAEGKGCRHTVRGVRIEEGSWEWA